MKIIVIDEVLKLAWLSNRKRYVRCVREHNAYGLGGDWRAYRMESVMNHALYRHCKIRNNEMTARFWGTLP